MTDRASFRVADEGTHPAGKLEEIVATAARVLPGIDHVTLTRANGNGTLEVLAASDEVGPRFDELQSRLGEGPCIHAALEDAVTRVAPARHEQRWPKYVSEALEQGLTAQLALCVEQDEVERVSLNLYSTTTEELDPGLDDTAAVFAAWAAVSMGRSLDEANYRAGLLSRTQIGTAIGLVMATYGLDEDQAFQYLRRRSSQENTKIRDLAATLIERANESARDAKG